MNTLWADERAFLQLSWHDINPRFKWLTGFDSDLLQLYGLEKFIDGPGSWTSPVEHVLIKDRFS